VTGAIWQTLTHRLSSVDSVASVYKSLCQTGLIGTAVPLFAPLSVAMRGLRWQTHLPVASWRSVDQTQPSLGSCPDPLVVLGNNPVSMDQPNSFTSQTELCLLLGVKLVFSFFIKIAWFDCWKKSSWGGEILWGNPHPKWLLFRQG